MTPNVPDPLDAARSALDAGEPWFYWAEPRGLEAVGLGQRNRVVHHPASTHGLDWTEVDVPGGPTFVTVAFDTIDPAGPWRDFAPVELIAPVELVQRERPRLTESTSGGAQDIDPGDYPDRVAAALRAIDAGLVQKVVVARVQEGSAADPIGTLRGLRAAFPTCWIFARSNGTSIFLGATPERLLSLRHDYLQTVALAGSIERGTDGAEDARLGDRLCSSEKDRDEHRWVVDAIRDDLTRFCTELVVPDTPRLRQLENVQHLETPITGVLSPDVSPLDLVGALHPTPAVCGHPRGDAARLIRELEPFDRGLYAGVVGLLDDRNADLCVGIRSALFDSDSTRLYAGAGIVAGSDPDTEHRETAAKLQAVARWTRRRR